MAEQSVALSAYRKALVAYLKVADGVREAIQGAQTVEDQQMKAFAALGRECGLIDADDKANDPAALVALQREETAVALETLGWDKDHPTAKAIYAQLAQLSKEVELFEQIQAAQNMEQLGKIDGPVL